MAHGAFHQPAALQHTLKSSIDCTGVGLHSGVKVAMALHPAEPDTGIVFRRTDVPGSKGMIPARWNAVVDTRMNSTLGNRDGVAVGTVEHLMAALSGCGVDNAIIEVDGPELPIMDGSSAPFVFLIECVGIAEQNAPRRYIEILKEVHVGDGEHSASVRPCDHFAVSFAIDFEGTLIRDQSFSATLVNGTFRSEIARARTFGFEHEVSQLRAAGLARGGSLDNAIVVSGHRVLNDGGLRFDDEFVRHKVLDSIGDLYLAGGPLLGHFHGQRSGHALNNALLQALFADETAWRRVIYPSAATIPPEYDAQPAAAIA
jgi:UDP-3-O-[3-hydroxymyristoyl] N-acetylglucosamine deacetylase